MTVVIGNDTSRHPSYLALSHTKIRLTPHEKKLLIQAQCGATTKELAKEMHLSPEMSRNQLSHVMTKLDCTNRLEAVHLAMKKGSN